MATKLTLEQIRQRRTDQALSLDEIRGRRSQPALSLEQIRARRQGEVVPDQNYIDKIMKLSPTAPAPVRPEQRYSGLDDPTLRRDVKKEGRTAAGTLRHLPGALASEAAGAFGEAGSMADEMVRHLTPDWVERQIDKTRFRGADIAPRGPEHLLGGARRPITARQKAIARGTGDILAAGAAFTGAGAAFPRAAGLIPKATGAWSTLGRGATAAALYTGATGHTKEEPVHEQFLKTAPWFMGLEIAGPALRNLARGGIEKAGQVARRTAREAPIIKARLKGDVKGVQAFQRFWKSMDALEAKPESIAILEKFKAAKTYLAEQFIDRHYAGKQIIKQIEKATGVKIPVEQHPGALAELYAGRHGIVSLGADELAGAFQSVKSPVLLERYLYARRIIELADRGIKIGGVSKQEAAQFVRAARKMDPRISKAAKRYWAFARGFLDYMHKGELISDTAYKNILKRNKHWIPFSFARMRASGTTVVVGGEYFSVGRQDVIKAIKGNKGGFEPVVEATMRRFIRAVDLVERNKVAKAIVGLQKETKKVPGMRNLIRRLPRGFRVPKDMGTINVFRHGKAARYAVPLEMERAFKHLSLTQIQGIGRWVSGYTNLFRRAVTSLYMPFMMTNAPRDYLMAQTLSTKYGFNPGTWFRGFLHATSAAVGKQTPLYKSWLKHGGGFTSWMQQQRSFTRMAKDVRGQFRWSKLLKAPLLPLEVIARASEAVELAPRIGIYGRALRGGATPTEAAHLARTTTINFSQAGRTFRAISQWVPFLNARLRATTNVMGALASKSGPEVALRAIALVDAPALATYAWNRVQHSELYDDIPREVRDNFFCLVTGSAQDDYGRTVPKYLRIAKGSIGTIFWNPIEYGLDYLWEKDRENTGRFLTQWASDLLPVDVARQGYPSAKAAVASMMPPIAKPGVEVMFGENLYFGTPIVPETLKRLTKPEQYTEDTSKLAIRAAGKINKAARQIGWKDVVSPIEVEYVARNILGSLTREAPWKQPRRALERVISTRGGQKERELHDLITDSLAEYASARMRAIRAVRAKNVKGAIQEVKKWNSRAIKEIAPKIRAAGYDPAKFLSQVTISDRQELESLVRSAFIREEAAGVPSIERRLKVRTGARKTPAADETKK